MFSIILSMLLPALPAEDDPATDEVQALISEMESLLKPVEDFRCEFEGMTYFYGKVARQEKTGPDGLADSYSGYFIWKNGGDVHSNTLHREPSDGLNMRGLLNKRVRNRPPDGTITRQILLVRTREQIIERTSRDNDSVATVSDFESLRRASPTLNGELGQIFLIDQIKRSAANENYKLWVTEDQIDGRPMKVINTALRDLPDRLMGRYWIDLGRNGHVVRREGYGPDMAVIGRQDITLDSFKVGDTEVWMPVSGDYVSYGAVEKGRPVFGKEPTIRMIIKVAPGTMEFNKHPAPNVFTMNYKPGPPISDTLRAMTAEFAQQKIGLTPTPAGTSKLFPWPSWMVWGLGTIVLVLPIAIWIKGRGTTAARGSSR